MPSLQQLVDPLGMRPRATRAGGRLLSAAGDASARAAVGTLERALGSPYTDQAVDLVVDRLLFGSSLPERVADELLARGVVERVMDRVLGGPEIHRLVGAVLESPQFSALVAEVLESDALERLVTQVMDSRLVDAGVAHVLEGDDLWLIVEEVASSPAVTEAISRQGVGFADQVAGEVGRRSRKADARLERAARRLLRRRPPPPEGTGGPLPAAGAP